MTTNTKECIADALIYLMREMPFKAITITEIVDYGQVSRASFYRNFNSKEEVLLYKIRLLWTRWAENRDPTIKENLHKQTTSFFEFLKSIQNVLIPFYTSGQSHIILKHLYTLIGPDKNSDREDTFRRAFYVYGMFGIMNEWILGGMHESPHMLSDLITSRLTNEIVRLDRS